MGWTSSSSSSRPRKSLRRAGHRVWQEEDRHRVGHIGFDVARALGSMSKTTPLCGRSGHFDLEQVASVEVAVHCAHYGRHSSF